MPNDLTRLIAALARAGGASSDFDLNPGLIPKDMVLRAAAVLVGRTPGLFARYHRVSILIMSGEQKQNSREVIFSLIQDLCKSKAH